MLQLAPGSRFFLRWFHLPRLRLTWSHLWRCSIIALMLLTYVAGMWAGMVSPAVAHAAVLSHQRATQMQSRPKPPRHGAYASSISPCPALTGTPEIEGSLDGLGTLSAYTFVKHNADDRLLMETNVINGNLVAQYNALQIQGTGLNLNLTLTYNSLASRPGVLGANWNLSVGNGVSLSFNGSNANFYGPSGFKLPFEADSNSYGTYAEPPGIDATLLNSTVNGATHVLIFQHTSECLGFNSSGQEIFDQDKNGHQITFAYNSSGNLTSVTDTQNRLTTFGYDANGRINLITDPSNRTVQLGYDSNNNLHTIIDLNGKTTTLGYTPGSNDLTSIATPVSGHKTTIGYQTSGNRVNQITDALTNNTYVAYYSQGSNQCGSITTLPCTTFKDANNHTTIYGSDDLQVKAVLDGNGNMASTSYTPDANINQYTDPLNHATIFGYQTSTNNLSSVTDGSGAGTSYDYDDPNPYLPTKVTDAQGNTINYVYDSHGNLKSATDSTTGGTGSSAIYTYNTTGVAFGSYLYGLLLKVQDGDGNITSYSYDTYGNLHYVTPPSPLGQQTIVVDAVSRLKSVTDGRGNTVTITPDPLDRITSLAYPNGTVSYVYNDDGDEKSVTDGTGTTSFLYDADNRLKVKTLPNSATLSVTYDPVGNVQTYADSGGTVTYFYDSANRLKQVQEPDGSTTAYGYNNANELTSISYPSPNNTGEVFGYDGAGHVTSAVAGIMNSQGQITTTYASFTYSYLNGTTPTQLIQTDTLLDPVGQSTTYTRHYKYDTMNRLQEAEVDQNGTKVQDWSYVYDKAGNRTQSTVLSTGASTSYSYNAAEELTQTVQGSTTVNYSYDGNGNLTSSSDGNSFTYNKKNQTSAINSNSYTYTGPDQTERVQLNGTTDAYSGLGLSYETTSGNTTYYTRCSCGRLINERLPSGGKYYYLFDGQGSVVGLTDGSNGKEVDAYDYDPYGGILNVIPNQPSNPFQYEGGYFESSTGLVKFGTRYYNPNLGRWTQQDPVPGSLASPDTLNLYLYTQDDPVNMVDPSGKMPCWLAAILAFAFIIAAVPLIFLSLPLELVALLYLLLGYVGTGLYAFDSLLTCS